MALLLIVFILVGLAMLAIEVVDSELSLAIKNFFNFTPENRTVRAARKLGFYKRVFGGWFYVLFLPIVIPALIFYNAIFFLIKLFDCPFCLSFHFGWITAYYYLGTDVFMSIIMGAVTLLITKIIDKFVTFKW